MAGDYLATLLLGALALILGAEAYRLYRRGLQAARWPTASGRITGAELEEGPMMGRFVRTVSHRAAITYAYQVGGREWRSKRVFFGDEAFATGTAARDRVRKYEPESTVQVYYDPDDPSQAVLEPRAAWRRSARRALTWGALTVVSLVVVYLAGSRR